MTHEDIKILISAYFDNEVTPSEKNIVEEHLKECAPCQKDYKTYMSISSSLSKWSNEALSPDEEIKMRSRFEKRREPMFTQRNMMAFGTTLALFIIVGSIFQIYLKRGVEGRLKSSADDIGDQYSDGHLAQFRAPRAVAKASSYAVAFKQYEPYYLSSEYSVQKDLSSDNKRLGPGLVGNDAEVMNVPTPVEKEHKVIKNANITIKVLNAEKTQTELENLVAKYEGIIVNFQIYKVGDSSRSGQFVFSVLPKHLKALLPELRKLGEVQTENQSGVDITNQYEYLQNRLEDYQANKDRLQRIINKHQNDPGVVLDAQSELTSVQANINNLDEGLKQLDDQSYMATVVVNFYDVVTVAPAKEITLKERIASSFKSNLEATLQVASNIGICSFNGLIIVWSFLLQVAVWLIIFGGVFILIRKFFKK